MDKKQIVTELKNFTAMIREVSASQFMDFVREMTRAEDISLSHMGVLKHLYFHKTSSPSQLADLLQISSGGVTQLCDKLVQKGFIERMESPEDRRVKLLAITDRGKVLLARQFEVLDGVFSDLVEELGPDLASQVGENMQTVNHALHNTFKYRPSVSSDSKERSC